jgi:phage repressor protein C with HTH and peptisase S24 domain
MKMSDNERFFFIYEELKKRSIVNSQTELAEALGTNKTGISDLKQGRKKISIENIKSMKLSYPQVNVDFYFTEMGNPLIDAAQDSKSSTLAEPKSEYLLKSDKRLATQRVPLYNTQAAAGLVRTFSDPPNVLDYISIPNLPKCDGAIYITGDSMYPLLKSGDIIAYKRINDIKNGIMWGEMYLLSFMIDDEDFTMVKYIQKSEIGPDYVKLVSQNQHHQAKDVLLTNITALALIKASIRFNSMN